MLLTDCDNVANTNEIHTKHSAKCQRTIREMRNEHSARRRGRFTAHAYPHYQLRVFTLLNTYIHFTEYVHLHYRTRISTLPNTCICIIKYTFPHHRTRISVCHFVGVYVYAGAINRPLRLRTVCDNAADGLR